MNKARITYRLESMVRQTKEPKPADFPPRIIPLLEAEFRVVDEKKPLAEPLNQYTNNFGNWSSPYDTETQRIEQMIRNTNDKRMIGSTMPGPADHPVEHPEEHRQGFRPDEGYRFPDDLYESSPNVEWRDSVSKGTRILRQQNFAWIKITVSVAGAAIIGVLLGFFVLAQFSADPPADLQKIADVTPIVKSGAITGKTEIPIVNSITDSAKPDNSAAAVVPKPGNVAALAAVNIPERTYAFLQNGGYTTAQAAEASQVDLRKKGLAPVTEHGDKYFVYVGMSPTRDNADALSRQLKSGKIEIYVKNYSLPGLSKIRWNGKTEPLQTYLNQSDKLVQMISGITLAHLEESKSTPLDNPTLQSLKTAHEAWSGAVTAVNDGTPDDLKPLLLKMNNAMNTAKLSMDEYKKNPNSAMLWQGQTSLMQFILAEKELLTTAAN